MKNQVSRLGAAWVGAVAGIAAYASHRAFHSAVGAAICASLFAGAASAVLRSRGPR